MNVIHNYSNRRPHTCVVTAPGGHKDVVVELCRSSGYHHQFWQLHSVTARISLFAGLTSPSSATAFSRRGSSSKFRSASAEAKDSGFSLKIPGFVLLLSLMATLHERQGVGHERQGGCATPTRQHCAAMQNGTAGVYDCEVWPVKTTVQTVEVVEGVSVRLCPLKLKAPVPVAFFWAQAWPWPRIRPRL